MEWQAWFSLFLTISVLVVLILSSLSPHVVMMAALTLLSVFGVLQPFVLAIMIAASASFATPLGYQTNLMVYGPGAYKFSDFLKVGLPMNIFVAVISIVLINTFWGLW